MGRKKRKKRRSKQQRAAKRRGKRQKPVSARKSRLDDLELDDRISVVGIPALVTGNSVEIAPDWEYVIQDDPNQIVSVRIVPQALINKFKAVSNRFTLELIPKRDNPKHQQMIASMWPQNWTYLSASQIEDLKGAGVIRSDLLPMENISLLQFGEYLYGQTDVQKFLDTFTEISWIDYVIRQQLALYEKIYNPKYVTIGESFEFNPRVAKCWMTLESCVIRIAGLWDRLRSFLLPLYFFGQTFEDLQPSLNKKNPWGDLNGKILNVVSTNPDQKNFYELFVTAAREFDQSTFKNLRNRVVHEFVYRPEGAVPTGIDDIPALSTVEDLHQLVLSELDKLREAVIIFVAMMIKKQPRNILQNKPSD